MKSSRLRTLLLLALLTVLGVLVAGYHPGAEDDGVYLAAIQHNLNPKLFRRDAVFFTVQLQATVFDKVVAATVRLTHLPVAVMTLIWHLAAIFAILAACYRIASRCFRRESARWCGVAMVSVFMTLPVAGTALFLVDQNLHPRAIATALGLFAVDMMLERRYVPGFVLAGAAALFHPIMAAFVFSLCFFLALPLPGRRSVAEEEPERTAAWWYDEQPEEEAVAMPTMSLLVLPLMALPLRWIFEPASPAWRIAAATRSYYFLTRWTWYEWLGVIAPLLLLLWFARMGREQGEETLEHLAGRTALYGGFQLAVALLIALPLTLERMRAMQPMRYLHLIYLLMVLLGGCFVGDRMLRERRWRWAALFLPAALGMFLAQRAEFPASPHLELPGVHSSNPWLASFAWIRKNTPEDAYFVIGPDYMHHPGEDNHGFRALALRSVLADEVKDSAVVTQVPELAGRWQREVRAQETEHGGWQKVTALDLHRLKSEFGVNWAIVERPAVPGLDCPYQNSALEVCRID